MEETLKENRAVWLTPSHCVIQGEKKDWEIHVYKNAPYPDSDTIFPWKVDTQFFSYDHWAEKYLLRLMMRRKQEFAKSTMSSGSPRVFAESSEKPAAVRENAIR